MPRLPAIFGSTALNEDIDAGGGGAMSIGMSASIAKVSGLGEVGMCPGSGTAVARLERGVVDERIGTRSRIPDKNQVTLLGADSGYEVGSTSGPGDANTKRSRGDDFIPQNLKGYGPILQMIEVSNFLQSLV
jgi:hypothetical protein